jgi:ribosomal protein S18 acetylase RimI-like enzyme
MIQFKPLANISFDRLFEAFASAFSDYEIQPNKEELAKMIYRRAFNANLSFGAFENDKLVSFTFNGIGLYNGLRTAYDTGTGTLKEYRGQGLASRVFEESIPHLLGAGIEQYLLEVLQHNTSAVSVYRKQGFEVTREFNYFVKPMADIKLVSRSIPDGFTVDVISLIELSDVSSWWDYIPSWQNSFDAINRKPEDFIVLGAKKDNVLVGYGIIEPSTGDITQIAVDRNFRRMGIGTFILGELLSKNKYSSIKHINSDVTCVAITNFLEKNGIQLRGTQFEMIKKL